MSVSVPTKPLPKPVSLLLKQELGNTPPRLTLRTRTRIDTGKWLGRSPIWLCVTDEQIVLVAVSKRRYFESIRLSECAGSRYCHTTGRLVIEPADRLRFAYLAMSPGEALRVIELIEQGATTPQPYPSNDTENNSA